MADPLSGLAIVGTVGNIIQLLEVTGKIVQRTHEVLVSAQGAVKENESLEVLTGEYDRLSSKICESNDENRPLTLEDCELDRVAQQCKDEAGDLLKQFQELKLDDSTHGIKRTWDGLTKAKKSLSAKREIERKHQSLTVLNSQLATRLLVMLRSELSDGNSIMLQQIQASGKRTLEAILDCKAAVLDAVAKQQAQNDNHKKKVKCILRELWFDDMMLRRHLISDAHAQTYEWIVQNTFSFRSWLQDRSSLFWVNGKAGSGKSTLMKFLASHTETRAALTKWSGEDDLVMTEFYFWYLGSGMQKSIRGLLQSILYQIISKRPDLTPAVCPKRWRSLDTDIEQGTWTTMWWEESELYNAIELATQAFDEEVLDRQNTHSTGTQSIRALNLSQQAAAASVAAVRPISSFTPRPSKFFFLIDGLDEYDGDHLQLAMNVKKWSACPYFKLCVSSRPWTAFNIVFGDVTDQLCLEDLTKNDIKTYVRSRLSAARAITFGISYREEEDSMLTELVHIVVNKAHGVFLWVYLVVHSIRQGLVEGDSMSTLIKRIEVLPSDLYKFFETILGRIDTVYARQTGQALLLAMSIADHRTDKFPLESSFINYWQLHRFDGELEDALNSDVLYYDVNDLSAMMKKTRGFLSACCKDLLLLGRIPDIQLNSSHGQSSGNFKDFISQYRVDFLHRTVYEFIQSNYLHSHLIKHRTASMDQNDFHARLALLRIKLIPQNNLSHGCICTYFYDQAMQVCNVLDTSTNVDVRQLDELGESFLKQECPDKCYHYQGITEQATVVHATLASYGSYRTFNLVLNRSSWNGYQPGATPIKGTLLQTMLGLGYSSPDSSIRIPTFSWTKVNLIALERLLRHGASPREEYKGHQLWRTNRARATIWEAFLTIWLQTRGSSTDHAASSVEEVFPTRDQCARSIAKLLLKRNSPMYERITHPKKGRITAEIALAELLPEWRPVEDCIFDVNPPVRATEGEPADSELFPRATSQTTDLEVESRGW